MDRPDDKVEETGNFLQEDHKNNKEKRENTWPNKVEFILSLFGYTSGVSDFWRFPYLTWRNGGGKIVFLFILIILLFNDTVL